MKKRKIIASTIALLILLLGFGWFWWVSDYYRADVAFSQISGTESVATIQKGSLVEYFPNNIKAKTGLIIYPGAKVDFMAYAPLAKGIAEKGYKTVVVKMPENIAIFGANKADRIIADNPDIENWFIAGHSLGGVIASQYALNNTDVIKGIVFWASYPSKNISSSSLKTLTLYGSNDGYVKGKKIEETKSLLPKDAEIMKIDGGNHSYFGCYGFQKGDLQSNITRDEQQNIIIERTCNFLSRLNK